MSVEEIFLASAINRLFYYKELGDNTFAQLNEADFHYQPNESSNSIAVIIQHMAGNMLSRWTDFLHSDGEKEWRNRDTEFEEQLKAPLISWLLPNGALSSKKKMKIKRMIKNRMLMLMYINMATEKGIIW